MKTLTGKVRAIERIHIKLDREIAGFQKDTGLACISGCGECCKKPNIDATPLEFLPLALRLFDEGKAEKMYEELGSSTPEICVLFRPYVTNFGGMCSEYPERPLVCRLFGFSASRNKEGQAVLSTCKIIKESQTEQFNLAQKKIAKGKHIPVMSYYYSRLSSIDPSLSEFYPSNTALKKAIEVVMAYYAYRKRPKKAAPKFSPI